MFWTQIKHAQIKINLLSFWTVWGSTVIHIPCNIFWTDLLRVGPCPPSLKYQAASSQARLKSVRALPPWARVPVPAPAQNSLGATSEALYAVYSLTSHLDDKRSAAVSLARVPVPASSADHPLGNLRGRVLRVRSACLVRHRPRNKRSTVSWYM